jgi:protein phosphatase
VADIGWDERQRDDIFVLCSDGLTDMISEEEMERVLRDEKDVDQIATRLIDAANNAGGKDNVSVIICKT